MAASIHHIGIGVVNEKPVLKLFCEQLDFDCIAIRETNFDKKWVLKRNKNLIFVVTKLNNTPEQEFENGCYKRSECVLDCSASNRSENNEDKHVYANYDSECRKNTNSALDYSPISTDILDVSVLPHFSLPNWHAPQQECDKLQPSNNSVYEVSIEVNDVNRVLNHSLKFGAELVHGVRTVKDDNGSVCYAVIRSCVGNVIHTIVNSKDYHGCFLPTFQPTSPSVSGEPASFGKDRSKLRYDVAFDHITLCVPPGRTADTIDWYDSCLKMTRLLVNK